MTWEPSTKLRARLTAGAAMLLGAVAVSGCDGQSNGNGEQRPGSGASAEPAGGQQPVVGTFKVEGPIDGDTGGRLPADGDLAAYVPATTLFPGTARIDPAIRNPLSGDPEAVAAGERHFAAFNCGGCHAPLGGGGMGPPLSDDAWIYGSEPAQIYLSILHGRPDGMPAWSSMLPRRTIWELVSYVETLAEIQDPTAARGFDSLEVRTSRRSRGPGSAADRGRTAPAGETSPAGPDSGRQ